MVTYLSKKYATDRAFAEKDGAILCYVQSSDVTPLRYVNELISKSCKVVDVNDECILKDVFIEDVDASI